MFDRHESKKLETSRNETLSAIRAERLSFEAMVQRAQKIGEPPLADVFLANVHNSLAEIEQRAKQETNIDELDCLIEDAEMQGQLRAYICPRVEIRNEGILAIDLMEEWNVPKTVITRLRGLLGQRLDKADTEQEAARSALRAIFEEQDSWRNYTSEYEDQMQRLTRWLFVATMALLLLAIATARFSATVPLVIPIIFVGAAGSCVSIMAKMPLLDVSLSGELESYGRRILSRIGVGVIASLIGCGLLGWGIISFSIQGQTFADVLNACTTSTPNSCTGPRTLVLLTVPMLLGFSERALTSFERKVFGASGQERGRASHAVRK
jgi:hypothetical protein